MKLCPLRLFVRVGPSLPRLSIALPHPSSFRVSIELARENVFCLPFPVRGLRRRGLRGAFSLWLSVESVAARDFAARACFRRSFTADVKADWGAGSAGLVRSW